MYFPYSMKNLPFFYFECPILIKILHRTPICLCVCHVYVRAWHASISWSWMKEFIPIFWQMTDMVIDYTLEPFWVLDLHPGSQERQFLIYKCLLIT